MSIIDSNSQQWQDSGHSWGQLYLLSFGIWYKFGCNINFDFLTFYLEDKWQKDQSVFLFGALNSYVVFLHVFYSYSGFGLYDHRYYKSHDRVVFINDGQFVFTTLDVY